MSRSKYWCFTLNNYSEDEIKQLVELEYTYLIYGKETGTNGTPHLQGYIEFNIRKRLETIKNINPRIHWEIRKGTAQQAADYCKKEGDFNEHGTISNPEQGKRNDLKRLHEQLLECGSISKITKMEPLPFQKIRTLEKWLTYDEPQRRWKPEVIWIWGASGSGKSELLDELAGPDAYWKDGEKWWDGYDAHEVVVMDDFRASNMKFNFLLKVLDKFPLRVEFKGGYRQLLAKKIIISTIVHPKQVYAGIAENDEPVYQLLRRITKIIRVINKINGTYVPVEEIFVREKANDDVIGHKDMVMDAKLTGNTEPSTSSPMTS